jgi:hypothetical protein
MSELITSGIVLPLKDGTLYQVEEGDLAMWRKTYIAVDVTQQFREMYSWLVSNPSKRKTKKGIKRFINNWLSSSKSVVMNTNIEGGFIATHTDKSWADGL